MNSHSCTHFDLIQLAEGVFVVLHKEGGAAYSNAGFVDLGERVLLFDTLETLAAARELREMILQMTGRLPTWVVNSHKHADHWTGNQVFAEGAVLMATHQTRQGMLALGAELEAARKDPLPLENEIRELQARLEKVTDPTWRISLEASLARRRFALAEAPDFQFCPPEQTFAGRLTFHGSRRTAELVTTGPGHTPQECHLVLEEEKIVFTGDLAFFASPPFIPPDCDLDGWLSEIGRFIQMPDTTFVPGHGPLGRREEFEREQRYLVEMKKLVGNAVGKGMSLEDVLQIPMPEAFNDWLGYRSRQENNLRSLFHQLVRQRRG